MKRLLAVLAALLLWPAGMVGAQTWPSKPIKLVLSFGPGSASDSLSRIFTHELSQQLGQPVVIIHKPGADGTLSGIEVQRSAPDGYTFLFGTNSALAVGPNLRKEAPYNVHTDFTPISTVGVNTVFFVVHPSFPVKTLPELVAWCKANPGKLNAATGNTYAIVSNNLFAKDNGITIESIPYKTEPEANIDLLSGRVDMMIATTMPVLGHIRSNKLRVLATASEMRSPLWPEAPTMVESGQKQHPFDAFFVLVGPAGLPADIVARMNKEVVIALDKLRQPFAQQGVFAKSSTPEEATAYLKRQYDIWTTSMREAGIKPNE